MPKGVFCESSEESHSAEKYALDLKKFQLEKVLQSKKNDTSVK